MLGSILIDVGLLLYRKLPNDHYYLYLHRVLRQRLHIILLPCYGDQLKLWVLLSALHNRRIVVLDSIRLILVDNLTVQKSIFMIAKGWPTLFRLNLYQDPLLGPIGIHRLIQREHRIQRVCHHCGTTRQDHLISNLPGTERQKIPTVSKVKHRLVILLLEKVRFATIEQKLERIPPQTILGHSKRLCSYKRTWRLVMMCTSVLEQIRGVKSRVLLLSRLYEI